jgi:uncharacterized repeat protein (TIGR03806 family)
MISNMRISVVPGKVCVLAVCFSGGFPVFSQPYGLSNRVANTTLQLPSQPPRPPAYSYSTTNAFGNVSFLNPLAIVTPPGETNRLFVVEQRGVISVITNLAAPTRTVFMDISGQVVGGTPSDERGLLGLAFHPDYANNRYFYVYYSTTANTGGQSELHQRLSRFETSSTNPNQGLSNTETPLLTLRDEASNHNGGDLHFGPDGYLYVSTGDEGDANDSLNNSQMIDKDFWSGILRLDVDSRPENLVPNPHVAITAGTYRVPADNPFVGVTTWHGSNLAANAVRTEFYAVGLRNPWRFSFDSETGRLYCGDVGQGAREEIDIIEKGGNYGWAFREGNINGPKAAPAGANPIPPILDYSHGTATNQGNSVTGGVVYRGSRYPQLFGYYIFADYVRGNVWATHYDGTGATPMVRIAGDNNVAGFGIDPSNGDVLMADQNDDTIKRLVATEEPSEPFPQTLADTGAFADLTTLTTEPGIVPYDVNVPFWSDKAVKTRWFCIPNPGLQMRFRPNANWSFSPGTVWIKHFELEMTNGVPESRRRLETRFIVRDATATGIYGVTYRWDEEQTNATLVPAEGMDETLVLNDGGNLRTQVWHYPSQSECLACHTLAGGLALGFNTAQLNRDFDYAGIVDNQLRALDHAGYFSPSVPVKDRYLLTALAPLTDEASSVEYRVRSYLAANCAQCHAQGGSGAGSFDARIQATLPQTGLINGALNDNRGDPNNRVVVPGSDDHSMLLTRMAMRGAGQMPPLDSNLVDPQAVSLFQRWITNGLSGYQTFEDWQTAHFGSTGVPEAAATADPDMDGGDNEFEYLTGTDPQVLEDRWPSISLEREGPDLEVVYQRVANRGFEVQASANLDQPASWHGLNIPENRPFFASTNGTVRVPDSITNQSTRFYRVRVFEP